MKNWRISLLFLQKLVNLWKGTKQPCVLYFIIAFQNVEKIKTNLISDLANSHRKKNHWKFVMICKIVYCKWIPMHISYHDNDKNSYIMPRPERYRDVLPIFILARICFTSFPKWCRDCTCLRSFNWYLSRLAITNSGNISET